MTQRQEHKNLYWTWKAMKQRCQNPKCEAYRNYGARGIKVCEEWQEFEPFLEWSLNSGYEKGLELDCENNDGNYEPMNCRWITRRDNLNNRRTTIKITVNGETLPDTEWADKTGVDRGVLKLWLYNHGHDYVARRIKDILEHGYKKADYGYSHRKPVVHMETGMVFDSVRNAAKHFGITPCTISNAIRFGRTTKVGRFYFEELDDNENVIGGNNA